MAVSVAISEGFNGKGIEISKTARAFASKYLNVELYGWPLETFVLENKAKFDVVSFFGVLEHLTNPVEMLEISNRLLRKNGIVVLQVPNYDSLSTYIQKLDRVTDRHLDPTQHIMMFTLESAKYILRKTGFRPIAVWCYGMDVIELMKYLARKDNRFKNSELNDSLSQNLNELQYVFDKEMKGDEFLIIGKRIR